LVCDCASSLNEQSLMFHVYYDSSKCHELRTQRYSITSRTI
jgi:hypothetical protein